MSRKKGIWGMVIYIAVLGVALVFLIVGLGNVGLCSVQESQESVRLPILMYHDVCQDTAMLDDYTVSTKQLETDLAAIIQEGWTPVTLKDVICFAYGEGNLPPKPVLLVFDDGYRSFLTAVLPLLRKYEAPAVVSVIGEQAEVSQENQEEIRVYMNWDELRQVTQSGLVELQSHSAYLHVFSKRLGVARQPCESNTDYERMLLEDIQQMRNMSDAEQVLLLPSFAYPYGSLDPMAESILRQQGTLVTMTSEEHINCLLRSPESLYQLGRLNRSGFMTTEEVLLWMDGMGR